MTFRNTSGKFSLSSFGRRQPSYSGGPESPGVGSSGNGVGSSGNPSGNGREGGFSFPHFGQAGNDDREDFSPRADGGAGGPGLGWTLGKKIAHQSLLPALGNQDLKSLQGVITAEKGVLNNTEKLASDTQKAATSLPALGADEGPDLQDILTHSSTLLNHLSSALTVFAGHQSNMRVCYKRIREREEDLDELRRRRRATGAKAESAEKKLAKMGPENKALAGQTELLERLRVEMRQMDTDIVMEESKLGDFKRQVIKEALSLKFGGLEELGEKMCIIGELGKLLLEEIPLEETPPGYGRAPYTGYDKTENAVNEATRCLATVEFHAASNTPRPPGLPHHTSMQPLTAPHLPPQDRVAAAEEFANFPGNVASPEAKGKGKETGTGDYRLDDNPYGGYVDNTNKYQDFGGTRGGDTFGSAGPGGAGAHGQTGPNGGSHVVWQGPTEEALRAHQQNQSVNGGEANKPLDYEYEQQKQLDAEEAAWRDAQSQPQSLTPTQNQSQVSHQPLDSNANPLPPVPDMPNPYRLSHVPAEQEAEPRRSWEPLNVKRERSDLGVVSEGHDSTHPTTNGIIAPVLPTSSDSHQHAGLAPPVIIPSQTTSDSTQQDTTFSAPDSIDLPPPNPAFRAGPEYSNLGVNQSSSASQRAPTPMDGFYTPMETPGNSTDPLESLEKLAAMEKTYSVDQTDPSSFPLPPPSAPAMSSSIPRGAAGGGASVNNGTASGRNSPSFGGPASPTTSGLGGKMSAAAFRRAAKPRTASYGPTSPEVDNEGNLGAAGSASRRLPVPPVGSGFGYGGSEPTLSDKEREAQRLSQQIGGSGGSGTGTGTGNGHQNYRESADVGSIMATKGDGETLHGHEHGHGLGTFEEGKEGGEAFEDAKRFSSPPPSYAGGHGMTGGMEGRHENESLR